MKALTLIQPWAWAICHAGKRIENRGWKPPRSLWGERIAIHAGKQFDADSALGLFAHGYGVPSLVPHGAIVATARIVGVVTERKPGDLVIESALEEPPTWILSPRNRVWFCGPVGWILDEIVVLREPIPCKGAQRLWTVPADVERQVLGEAA
jgi:hypothetical protein